MVEKVRINKYISSSGFCSRREADKLIEEKKVKINGKLADIGSIVTDPDIVTVLGKRIYPKKNHVYLMFNKPRGITCTTEKKIKGNIIDYINYKVRIFPVGRLDKDSEGLIILTSDGDIVNYILRKENENKKTYHVKVSKEITPEFKISMEEGVVIYNPVKKRHEKTLPCSIEIKGKDTFEIVLSQGLNRQIRRMCQMLGQEVISLKRVQIMHLKLGNLKTGEYRELNKKEMELLFKKQQKK